MPGKDGHDRCVAADDRAAGPGDAASLLALKKQLDRETSFMLPEPDERTETSAGVAADLTSMAGAASTAVVVAAETGGRLVGYAEARGGGFRRNRITAYLVLGVLAAARGQGETRGATATLWTSCTWPNCSPARPADRQRHACGQYTA